jgi:hypothetical protein
MCAVMVALTGGGSNMAPLIKWVDIIGDYIKSIDKKHLYEVSVIFWPS